jgi:hypothetical protein
MDDQNNSFVDIPPFPNDIPTAPLLRLSLSRLRTSATESKSLFTAATTLGFFYLDLRHDKAGDQLLREVDELFKLSKDLFDLGREELDRFDYRPIRSYMGYKGFGKGVVDQDGSLDRNEYYNVSLRFSFTLSLVVVNLYSTTTTMTTIPGTTNIHANHEIGNIQDPER